MRHAVSKLSICVALALCALLQAASVLLFAGSATAATPGLPYTEDFSNTALRDPLRTNANWSTAEQALVSGWRRKHLGAGLAGTNITRDLRSTLSVALGDVDGDGDLDLIAGNNGQANRLYLNNGTAEPWNGAGSSDITTDVRNTTSVALGDVDGDGDSDLVAGNYSQANRLYLNNGTANPFSGVSGANITHDAHDTYSVALGDVDGDGDLDLVVGNLTQINRLYRNNGTSDPWRGVSGGDLSADAYLMYSVALGNLDSDGDLDLVGNQGHANRLYRNIGTAKSFGGAPVPLTGVEQVAAGHRHSCAVRTGGAMCWGRNDFGQLGNNSTTNRALPANVSGLASGVAAVATGWFHSCALTVGGGVKCWGHNGNGRLGDGTNTDSPVPVDVFGLGSGVAAIAVAVNHTCALTTGGGVKCWGFNANGRLGNGTTTDSWTPVDVSGLTTGASAISAGGGHHTCAIATGGTILCWGAGGQGQLGDFNATDSSVPVAVGLGTAVWSMVSVGSEHTCGVRFGAAWCWGNGASGQLGIGATLGSIFPQQVTALASDVVAIAAGGNHSCALTTGGGLKCWGANASGQIGDGTGVDSPVPANVSGLASGVSAISAGTDHNCAVVGSGAKCWGHNENGALGDGSTTGSLVPVTVVDPLFPATLDLQSSRNPSNSGRPVTFTLSASGPSGTPAGSVTFKDGGVDIGGCVAVALASGSVDCTTSSLAIGGRSITAAYSGDGAYLSATSAPLVQVVGDPVFAVLGLQASPTPSDNGQSVTFTLSASGTSGTPTGSVTFKDGGVDIGGCVDVALAAGSADCTTSALASGSHSITVAYSGDGVYANSTSAPLTHVVGYPILTVVKSGSGSGTITSTPAGINCGATCSAAPGPTVTLLATAANGSASSWPDCPSPSGNECTVVMDMPRTVTARFDPTVAATSVGAGGFHTCALTMGGGVKCWGSGISGALGNSTTTDSSVPVNVTGLASGVVAIAAGGGHHCALTTGSGVKCWGYNMNGELGNGGSGFSTVPVDVSGLTSGVAKIASTHSVYYNNGLPDGSHTCAITTGGGVKCWGTNGYGQLGNGTTSSSSVPVDVSGLASGVEAIALGFSHTCAVITGGGVKCWGRNTGGQLGDNSTVNSSVPVNVSGLSSGIASLAAGEAHTCARTTGGGVKCWGRNWWGELGVSGGGSTVPIDLPALTSGVAAIAAGGEHNCVITTGGGMKCWGRNTLRQLGIGPTAANFSIAPVDVPGLTSGVAAISAAWSHTCAVSTSGGVKCWGNNGSGQLGDGSTTLRASPVDVSGGLGTPGLLLQTIVFGANPGPLTYAPSGTFTVSATGGASGNPVTFTSSTSAVCTTGGSNGATVTIVTTGACTIAANQAGNATHSAAPQVTQSITIDRAEQDTLTATSGSTSLIVGQTATLGSTGGSGTGALSFASNNANCTVTGTTLTAAAAGGCTITATQADDPNYNPASSAGLAITTLPQQDAVFGNGFEQPAP